MEVLDLKFAGVSLWEWCGVIGFLWLVLGSYTYWLQVWRDWKERKKREEEYEAAKKAQDEIGEKVALGMRDAMRATHENHREACSPVRWEREVDLDSQTDQHRDGQEHNNPR
jgi:hypothetical protein